MELATTWRDHLYDTLRLPAYGDPLKRASKQGRAAWTTAMTHAVVAACEGAGWDAAARNHTSTRLPIPRSEYLAIDVMAFAAGSTPWPWPLAVMELENQQNDDYIAYDLWKVLCVRAALRVVVCYRPEGDQGSSLVQHLASTVVASLPPYVRLALGGETLLVIGSHADAGTFPNGFFRWWRLEENDGMFVRW